MTHSNSAPMLGAPASGEGTFEDSYERQEYRDGFITRKNRRHKAQARRNLRRIERRLVQELVDEAMAS